MKQERPERPARRVTLEQEKQVPQAKLEVRVTPATLAKLEAVGEPVRPVLQELRELRDYLGPQVKLELRAIPEERVLRVLLVLPERQE